MEIRETSEKTKENGKMRILATLTAVGVGLPIMFLTDWLWGQLPAQAYRRGWRRLFCWREACLSYARQITGMPCVLRAGNCNLYRFDRQPF